MRLGYFLASEEHPPQELVRQARRAEQAGFQGLWISDHFHPWMESQGQSPFVWSVIGAIAQATERIALTTGVTCPTLRMHPAINAHAAATAAVMLPGRFAFGVGSGEALNEHVLGTHWPEADVRLEMLEEAIEVIRLLWQGGQRSHRGRHYTVENARLYTLPDEPPPILVSGFGPKSAALAGRIGDGYVITFPSEDLIGTFRQAGGEGKPIQAGMKVCYGEDEAAARATAHELWRNEALPGELAQVLPTPAHFEQASELVTEEMVAANVPCGPDLEAHLEKFEQFAQVGVDELYVQQIGSDQEAFFSVYEREILPRFAS